MKKMKTMLVMMLAALAPFTFTSCDDEVYWYDDPWWYVYDDGSYYWNTDYYYDTSYDYMDEGLTVLDEAQVLAGEWRGTMQYYTAADKSVAEFNVNMLFVQNNPRAIKGTGIEVDSYNGESQTLNFTWYIDAKSGDIYIRYDGSGNTFVLDINARDKGFYLSEASGEFYGYMLGTNNNDAAYFNMVRSEANAKPATRAAGTKTFGQKQIQKPTFGSVAGRLVQR